MTKFAHDTVVPNKDSEQGKKEQVAEMFDQIAFRYDFLNRFLSAGIDVSWRKKALSFLKEDQPEMILDVATGTADLAIMAAKTLAPKKIVGIDISEGMLKLGKLKIEKEGLNHCIELLKGDSETINFEANTFDAVTVAFGVRNFQNLEQGLFEIYRVLKPGGKMVILEFSQPTQPVAKFFYNSYNKVITPFIGKLFSKNRSAYQYLDESIKQFPVGKNFTQILEKLGFNNIHSKKLSLGICTIYCGKK